MKKMYNVILVIVGSVNIGVAILHIAILFIGSTAYQYFGAPMYFVQNSHGAYTIIFMLLISVLFFLAGLYAFSAAGVLRELPCLRCIVLLVGIIYTLRGAVVLLAPFPEMTQMLIQSYPNILGMDRPLIFQDWVFSFVWLIVGIGYLLGTWYLKKHRSIHR